MTARLPLDNLHDMVYNVSMTDEERKVYNKDYARGWASTCDLDYADRRGYTRSEAWNDGRADAYMMLPKWHRRDCDDTMGHNQCDIA